MLQLIFVTELFRFIFCTTLHLSILTAFVSDHSCHVIYVAISISSIAVVHNLGSREPQGFGESVSVGARIHSK